MDNKTLVSNYVADESERLNQSLKDVLSRDRMPTSEEKDALLADMEATLKRLTSALEFLTSQIHIEEEELPVA